ncbi:MAG TPA: MFS transporter [Actinophytocola sp.]|uniref:MFS transporter n=1 Tax=Actinophytocola sp. TaxID=1872138 RepID=UPI002DB7D4A0|nr:MFS transporter [Actinophytocola sp.]HEU5475434.1 MFS transporter [Actinophytocola sp.]
MGSDGGSRAEARPRSLLGRILIDVRPLRIREFRRLWTTTAVTAVGGQLSAVAVPKQVYDITGSSGWVGLTGAVGLVALIVFGLWGGAISDAFDRRTVMIVSGMGLGITSALLWLQAFAGLASVWVILVLLGVQQACLAVNGPARNAAIPRLVPVDLVPQANALGFTVFMFGMVFGPLAAGALIPVLGLSTLYLIDTVALFLAQIPLFLLPAMPPGTGTSTGAGIRDILAGFRYMATKNVLLASFVIDLIAMVAGLPRALFPEMAQHTFGDPPGGGLALGLLYAAMPIGAVLGGLFSGSVSRLPRQGVVVTFAVILWGAAVIAFGFSTALLLAVLFLAIGGAADLVSAIHRNAILQTAATDEMRGRMQGAFTVVVSGGPRIADLLHGWAATTIGTAATTIIGGTLVIILTIIAVALLPAFWRHIAPTETTPTP